MLATIVGVVGAFIGLAVLVWQTVVSRNAANAAKASADAAISAERAWIMVDLEKPPGVGGLVLYQKSWVREQGEERDTVSARIRCVCSNQGKTPAKILEKRAALVIVGPSDRLPNDPNLDIEIQDGVPHYLQSKGDYKGDWLLSAEGVEKSGSMLVVYGIVKYTNIFSTQEAYTSFGYRITPDYKLERLTDYPRYNENT